MVDAKEVVARFVQAFNAHDLDAALACVADEFVDHTGPVGAKGLRASIATLFKAMPDLHATCEDVIAEDDRVVCRLTVRGTQTGPFEVVRFALAATGRRTCVEQIHIYRVKEGRLVEHWAIRDDVAILRQLGVPPFAQTT